MATLADRLREAMEGGGWSQGRLATEVGVTQGTISQILLGNTLRSRYLPEIADVLGVPLRWLKGDNVAVATFRTPPDFLRDDRHAALYLKVDLPPEDALVRMFVGLLASIKADADPLEQAQLLAKRLPTALARVSDLRRETRDPNQLGDAPAAAETPSTHHHERQG